MKKSMTYAVTALFATIALSIAAPDKEAIMAKEKAAWQAFKDRKADDFKKVVSPDVATVYAEGFFDMQKELAEMQKWDMKSFEFSDYKITSIDKDAVISTYTVKVEGSYDGKDASGTYNSASVWKKEKGDWVGIFHTNIKEAVAAPTPATSP